MDPSIWTQLTRRESLLAAGVTLVMVGVFLRGFARSARRELARRKQHRLAERKSAAADLNRELDRPPGWFEQHLDQLATGALLAGAVLTAVSFFRT